MIQKTRGLVIHTIKYTDNSVISHIYTEDFGRQVFLIKGARGKRSSAKINLLQHLSILEMEAYIKQNRDMQSIKEIRLHEPFCSIPYDPSKNAIGLFVSEILYKTLQEQESNPPLFEYLINSIKMLDLAGKGFANFHLLFLIGFSKYLGFYPRNNYSSPKEYFDIVNARFTGREPLSPHYISPPASHHLHTLMECTFEEMDSIRLTGAMRNILLEGILDYYRYHVAGMGQVKSFPVLREIFR